MRHSYRWLIDGRIILLGALLFSMLPALHADDKEPKEDNAAAKDEQASAPLARYLTVTSPVDDTIFGRVKNAALELQNQALQEDRRGILLLEITPGSSPFHQVYGLAKELTSARLSKITIVAWVPETVTGNNAVLALACQEIVMHPDAELGDIGHGESLEADEQKLVIALAEKRHNTKVTGALAAGMTNPQTGVYKVKIDSGDGVNGAEQRVVTPNELQLLRDNKAAILDVETICEKGDTCLISGRRARALDVLVMQTAENRAELAGLYDLPLESLREDATFGDAPDARLIRIDGVIDSILEAFLERQIQRSISAGANVLIFEVDSYGGALGPTLNLAHAIADLDPKKVRTVAYVPTKAISAAAIISLSCDEVYLHPDATMGDAAPINSLLMERAPEKILSFLREELRTLAEKNTRPTALLEAMADKDLEVFEVRHRDNANVWFMSEEEIHASNGEWIKGRLVHESRKDNILTVSGKRANELKLAQPPVKDFGELKQRVGIPPNVELKAVGRTWVDTLVFVLNHPAMTFLLFFIGMACIYLELFTMTGFFAIGSGVCFGLFFWSRFLGGSAGYLELTLFVLGLICIALEIFVLPGFGVFGVSGGVLIFLGLVLASQTWGEFGFTFDPASATRTLGPFAGSIVTVLVFALLMSRFLPQMKVFDRMALAPPGGSPEIDIDEPALRPDLLGESSAWIDANSLIGKRGVTISTLRPAGKAEIEGRYLDVVSNGPYIDDGQEVEVVAQSGNRIVVKVV